MKTPSELRQARQAAVAEMQREHPRMSSTQLDLYEARLHLADIDYLLSQVPSRSWWSVGLCALLVFVFSGIMVLPTLFHSWK